MFKKAIQEELEAQLHSIRDNLKECLKEELQADLRNTIERTCKDIVVELFLRHERVETRVFHHFSAFQAKTVSGEIIEQVFRHVSDRFNKIHKTDIRDFIAGEEFIDSVIARINKKQLA